jgi:lysophospholipase L1-like esterase
MGPYYFTGASRAVVDSYNEAIKNVAGTAYLDLRSVVDSNTMLEDGTHPNDSGARAIANQVEAALK